jgi:Ser/Thr protein kinase RdoA (MazF antagonist)
LTLSDATLRAALKAWHLPEPLDVRSIPSGLTSNTWYVEAAEERFVAKYAYQSRENFEDGLRAAELGERHGISSGAPLRTRDGKLTIMVEGPHGHSQPLALLRFISGEQLNPVEPDAVSIYGQLLGRIHRILLHEFVEPCSFDVYDYLLQEDAGVMEQPGLAQLIFHAVEAARRYEARSQVTYGVIWGDKMEILRENKTGRVGVVDWGTIESGPLLFDVALNILWFFPAGSQVYDEFIQAYLAESPISVHELEGLTYYKALLWARQAKYYAYRVAAHLIVGGLDANANASRLATSRQELESLLATL